MGTDEGTPHDWINGEEFPNDRNYRLFAALADVRNGFGFAGTPMFEPIATLAANRQLPPDLKVEDGGFLKRQAADKEEYWLGDHSYSWATVKEILEWPGWDQMLQATGVLSREQYQAWDKASEPDSWCGARTGRGLRTTSDPNDPEPWTDIQVTWQRSLRESCAVFLAWCAYAKLRYGENARLVFGFDS
jgi:hypothetical protein